MLAGIISIHIVVVSLFLRVGMDKPPEESMEVGTQSQSQMDTSNSQPVSLEPGDGDTEKAAEPEPTKFPTTLEGFKYKFNKEGQLRHTETGEPFVFKVEDDHKYNQLHYEALGEVVTNHVYDLLENETNLKRVHVPTDASEGEPQSFVFMSEDALTNPDRLMLLIHGSGVVRAGQWARRLIINDCLDSGTQLPFIRRAVEAGYGVIVLNTNENTALVGDVTRPVRENDSPVEHGLYVWKHFVSRAKAEHVAIIAHSYGGVVTVELAQEMIDDFKKRVFAIALTDSVHSLVHQDVPSPVTKFFSKVSRNWVSSKEALDTPIQSRYKLECPQVSAGTNKHEETSWSSFGSIFTFLDEMYNSVAERKKEEL